MAETGQTKVCRLCAETIKAEAKVCPYCRAGQRRRYVLTIHDWIMILTLLFFGGSIYLTLQLLEHGRAFSPPRDRIDVLYSRLGFRVTKWGSSPRWETNIVVVGTMTNASPYAWAVGGISEVEVRFFDRDGKITDTDRLSGEEFTILPHSDHSFRFYVHRKSIPEYANYRIYVRSAENPKRH